jgi:hypothetical protein
MAKTPLLRLLVASGVALLCAGCGGPADANRTSSASCAAPYLDDQPTAGPSRSSAPSVRPGTTITVYGHWYTSTCNDTGGDAPLEPLPPVHLTLTLPDGDVRALGEFSPRGHDMGFSAEVQIPAAMQAGTATVRDDQEHPAAYQFEVAR